MSKETKQIIMASKPRPTDAMSALLADRYHAAMQAVFDQATLVMDDSNPDQIGGSHYQTESGWAQPIEIIVELQMPFCWANCLKYLSRWERKAGAQDLDKALDYLHRAWLHEQYWLPTEAAAAKLHDWAAIGQEFCSEATWLLLTSLARLAKSAATNGWAANQTGVCAQNLANLMFAIRRQAAPDWQGKFIPRLHRQTII